VTGAVLTPQVIRHVLFHFGVPGGVEPGGFVTALLVLLAKADYSNRSALAGLWPEYVAAFEVATTREWGLDYLRALADAHDDDEAVAGV